MGDMDFDWPLWQTQCYVCGSQVANTCENTLFSDPAIREFIMACQQHRAKIDYARLETRLRHDFCWRDEQVAELLCYFKNGGKATF
jgi:hypothetical protein